jgi:anti-sigma-K factor RskA
MNDVHALSGAYAVDALDDLERAKFERHLTECLDCQHEVASLREASALLADTAAVTPPPALRDSVLAGIAAVRPLPPLGPEAKTGGSRRRFRVLVAAAAAVVAIGGSVAVIQPWDDDDSSVDDISPVERVLQAPDAESWSKEFPDGSQATVTRSKSLNQAVLETEDMAAPPEGSVYELWLQHDEEMVAAGFMPGSPDNQVLLSGDAGSADGAGITVEPDGGSPEPSGPVVHVFEFEST